MEKIAVIGAGISGLTVANMLKGSNDVTVFERESRPGGLVKCETVGGSLFHTCGGHVFNSKRKDVLDWFWGRFDREQEFHKAERYSVVFMPGNRVVPYPVENHVYYFPQDVQKKVIEEIMEIKAGGKAPENFEEFLIGRFGRTLYEQYFKPYNTKVWRRPLADIPLDWLEGKLPMPTPEEILFNNFNHVEEKSFVHSTFWYENRNGSQFIVDNLSRGLDIVTGADTSEMSFDGSAWTVCGRSFDKVVFCGNVKSLPSSLRGAGIEGFSEAIEALESHGTTSVFCEISSNPYSWVYLPEDSYEAHRIICTGNFSASNNAPGKMTGTVEFTDRVSLETILENLGRMPLNPRYLAHKYNEYTYPVQSGKTREMIASLKEKLGESGMYLCGRFAEWEYYNMDVAMGAAMDLCKTIGSE